MPIAIDHTSARDLAPQLDDALEIVCNEFAGLDSHQQYHNAFARVLKPDPLGRVLMMGTDQRDLFVPLLRQAVQAYVPQNGQIFDFGAGDGQTFAYVADAVPAGTTVSIEEPNPAYLAAYQAFLDRQPHLRRGIAVGSGIDDLEDAADRSAIDLPAPESVDLALGLHMIYFTSDVPDGLRKILRFVKPGGALFNVVTDESTAYCGSVLRLFTESGGDTGDNDGYAAAINVRRRLLAPTSSRYASRAGCTGTPSPIFWLSRISACWRTCRVHRSSKVRRRRCATARRRSISASRPTARGRGCGA
jgi:SAM-dependent methyltransferase